MPTFNIFIRQKMTFKSQEIKNKYMSMFLSCIAVHITIPNGFIRIENTLVNILRGRSFIRWGNEYGDLFQIKRNE